MHLPVLKQEVLKYLDPQLNENFIDCTIDGGGHALEIVERIKPKGRIVGIEADPEIYRKVKEKISEREDKERFVLRNDNFVNLKEVAKEEKIEPISGILFDLGFSSWHPDQSGKGFSFNKNEFLDMRYSSDGNGITAWEIVNRWPQDSLSMIFKEYGEERFSPIIAERIVERRRDKEIKTTFDLVEIIQESIPKKFQGNKIHFATRVFQALRIQVNDEIENIKKALPQAIEVSSKGSRLVVISFHSIEDRIVKHFFKKIQKEARGEILTKKPITSSQQELIDNPRSRSAKLRALKII